ncbi:MULTISPECIES: slipin family protein [unclassified Streptomyces]|uniref:slipin family protein n=1 Tax=unclassified Streptomyces TaxID=2593676 RepID=UPI00081B8468|nr:MULTISPECIES: slipin family protein [unclassified Streptomyces]MYQ52840.1 membrane protease subunit [Streptomyces sp. SID4941]SCD91881.1 Regulator of protease activity HflC, stomatin/prohibitin superfamily [Streptomyces sp. PalvLS-984]SDC45091.1 Regulator of protease activity HflC, stomatin/prohibitin superfamily [Streptomyces sp. AmelKG-A3]
MVQELVIAVVVVIAAAVLYGLAAARVVKQYERGVVLRLGRLHDRVRDPGFTMIIPMVDRLHKVNMQIVTMPVPAQDGITRDNVTVRVDAVIYFKVVDAASAVIQVEDYQFAVSQMAQTSLRSIIGKSDLDDLLSNREKLNEGLELMIDSPAVGWGVQIDRVEIKDVSLPETMKRSMARQAEADRERRARVINADAELQASKKLSEAAQQMSQQPAALQLRLLQTMVAVAAEKNSTLVLPFPVELLRFLERAQMPQGSPQGQGSTPPSPGEAPTEPSAPDPLTSGTTSTPSSDPLAPDPLLTGPLVPDPSAPGPSAPGQSAPGPAGPDPSEPGPAGSGPAGSEPVVPEREPEGIPPFDPDAVPPFEPDTIPSYEPDGPDPEPGPVRGRDRTDGSDGSDGRDGRDGPDRT